MINANMLRLSFCFFLVTAPSLSSYPIVIKSPETLLKQHNKIALALATIAALAYLAKPTESLDGTYAYSLDVFLNDPIVCIRNAFGWRKKEGKWKVNKHSELVFDAGYPEQGFVGVASEYGKAVIAISSLAVLLKTLEIPLKLFEVVGLIEIEKAK